MTVAITLVDQLDDPRGILEKSKATSSPYAERLLNEFAALSAMLYVGTVDGEVACVWGFIQPSLLSQEVYLWLLTTNLVEQHKFLFVRHSQRHVEQMLKRYPIIVGECVAGDTKAIKWLRLLGARFDESDGKKVPFTIRAPLHG